MAFEGLTEKLSSAFKKLRNKGRLTESDVKEAMREIRLALLEADVSYKVVEDFIKGVTEKAVGAEVLESLTPAQAIVKIVNQELINLMGGDSTKITIASQPPTVVMMVGLQGAGKTTNAAKLAGLMRKQNGKRPLLVACDIYRPAAIDQLKVVGASVDAHVFEMGQTGLREVPNPSEALLSGRPLDCSGSCITCLMEGTRPILVEIQALVTKTSFGNPRRVATGFDMNRTAMLLAVLEKRAGFYMGNLDVFVNAAGGMRADEPSADLAVGMAILSNLLDKVIPEDMLLLGEIGLAGEIRSTPQIQQRVGEGYRLGFRRFLLPRSSMKAMDPADYPEAEFIPVGQLGEAVRLLRN